MFYAVPPYFSSRLNCPLASINAFACNAAKRLFLFIPIQNSNSAESYAPYNMYRLTPTADSLELNYKVFFCFLVFVWVILNCKNIISKYFDLSSGLYFLLQQRISVSVCNGVHAFSCFAVRAVMRSVCLISRNIFLCEYCIHFNPFNYRCC